MIYPSAREVWVKQQRVELTSKEFDLLTLFVRNTTQIYTRELLMNLLGNNEEHYERRTIDTHVKNIRLKLSQALLSFDPIKTVRGVGYGFRQPGAKS
ncbi:winged helix-turn-helix domain-containing protein [Geomicrobium sp. JCM 19055]|uniref:winged helix-turn-helix domain-containing protein n=1 Tax=Geomicrobium sp. JCM 19055 TaxID=1460649 RepID=UPI0005A69BD4|nr:winged helix-turn-helix domain-containing protein [Geomicrobium sp. JCM 19055]